MKLLNIQLLKKKQILQIGKTVLSDKLDTTQMKVLNMDGVCFLWSAWQNLATPPPPKNNNNKQMFQYKQKSQHLTNFTFIFSK